MEFDSFVDCDFALVVFFLVFDWWMLFCVSGDLVVDLRGACFVLFVLTVWVLRLLVGCISLLFGLVGKLFNSLNCLLVCG